MRFDKFDIDKYMFWKEKEKSNVTLYKVLAGIGIVAIVAGAAYFVYKFFTPNYLDDFEDDDYFEFEDEE